jgi:hypothetical protein
LTHSVYDREDARTNHDRIPEETLLGGWDPAGQCGCGSTIERHLGLLAKENLDTIGGTRNLTVLYSRWEV